MMLLQQMLVNVYMIQWFIEQSSLVSFHLNYIYFRCICLSIQLEAQKGMSKYINKCCLVTISRLMMKEFKRFCSVFIDCRRPEFVDKYLSLHKKRNAMSYLIAILQHLSMKSFGSPLKFHFQYVCINHAHCHH